MLKIVFIILSFGFTIVSIGQNIKLSGLQLIPEKKRFNILALKEGNHFTVTSKNGVCYPIKTTVCYFENLKLKSSGIINPKLKAGRAFLLDVRLIKDKLLVLFSVGMKKTSKIYVQYYNKQCQPEGTEKLLIEIPVFANETNKSNFEYSLMISKDEECFSYSYCAKYDVPKQMGVMRYNFPLTNTVVYSNDFNKIHEFLNKENQIEGYLPINSFILDNGSFVHISGKIKEVGVDFQLFSEIKIVSINSSGKNEKDIDFDLNTIYNLSFVNTSNLGLIVSGIYCSEKSEFGGVFYNRINLKNLNIELTKLTTIDKDDIVGLIGEKQLLKAQKDLKKGNSIILNGLNLTSSEVLENGDFVGAYVFGEENSNILVAKICAKEEDGWKKILQRKPLLGDFYQKSNLNIKYDYVFSIKSDDNLSFYFNDNLNNYDQNGEFINQSKVAQFLQEKNFCFAKCLFDLNDGSSKRSIVQSTQNADTPVQMFSLKNEDSNFIFFYFEKFKQFNFGLIE